MRAYKESHPWITFDANDVLKLRPKTWMLLGALEATCEALASTLLEPEVAKQMYEVALTTGAQATTAIEGNTLTQEEVAKIHSGEYEAPPSREYQEREVLNVLEALDEIEIYERNKNQKFEPITAKLICDYNRKVLTGTEHDSKATPGEVRSYSVGVGNTYRGAPPEDCAYLLERLAEWLNSDAFVGDNPHYSFALAVIKAIYAHLYIAWIHPFGDGNGRTARLLEFALLARSGRIPLLVAHQLSNHYNLTRDRYYRELAKASATKSTNDFIAYAVEGFVDRMREQAKSVRERQHRVAWINYVHETMDQFPRTPARNRQRDLVLAMSSYESVSRSDISLLTPELAVMYAQTSGRALSRDLNRLVEIGLVEKDGQLWKATAEKVMRAFIPPTADL